MKPGLRYGGWLACAAAAAGLCAAVVAFERSYAEWGLVRMICDGCFVAGVVLLGLGALVWVANFGGFTALGYGWYLLVRKLSFSRAKFEGRMSYLEYVRQHGQKAKNPVCLLVLGLVCIAAAGGLLCLC